jgi:curved DNA-binding protein CbpA
MDHEDELDNIINSIKQSVEKNRKNKDKPKRESRSDEEVKKEPKKERKNTHESFDEIDYYKVIGASPSDSQIDIVKKIKEKVVKYHPDKTRKKVEMYPPEERPRKQAQYDKQYELIREAEKFLKEPEKRKYYDLQRKTQSNASFLNYKQQFEDFVKLKEEQGNTEEMKRLNEISYKQAFTEMNTKHGFNPDKNSDKINDKDFSRRMADLQLEREQQAAECTHKNLFERRSFDPTEFNKRFEADKMKREKRKKAGNDDKSIIRWDGIAAASDHGLAGGQYAPIDGETGLYVKDEDYIYATKIGSDDELSTSSIDDDILNDITEKQIKTKTYEELLKEREDDVTLFESMKFGTWKDVRENPFNPSHQMGEILGTDFNSRSLDENGNRNRMKKEKIDAYKALIYNNDD